jgi:hypothetical protein
MFLADGRGRIPGIKIALVVEISAPHTPASLPTNRGEAQSQALDGMNWLITSPSGRRDHESAKFLNVCTFGGKRIANGRFFWSERMRSQF